MPQGGMSDGRIVPFEAGRAGLLAILEEMQPMTVRQLFYQATALGLFHKTENGYERVQTDTVVMRERGQLPYEWIVDNTRTVHQLQTYRSPDAALLDAAACYRKSLWAEAGLQVQVWIEKDALSSTISPVTEDYDVPLLVARGYSSVTFLHTAAGDLSQSGLPAYIYHLGDFDPSGVDAALTIERDLRYHAPEVNITFKQLAVTEQQIKQWNLPSRPTKRSDSRSKNFGSVSVELDAIAPTRLRELVQKALAKHMPPAMFAALKQTEADEQRQITDLVRQLMR